MNQDSQHPHNNNRGIVEGHQARKRFGQNFLEDPQVIDSIIAAINPQASDNLVEIGPGLGAITSRLISELNHLHVVELDRNLIPFLIAKFDSSNKLQIHQADALNFDFTQLTECQNNEQPGKLRVVGNLPYNISTPLIFHLLETADSIQDMHFMLQKEVVDRLAAEPGSKTYGRLGIMVQYYCQVEALFMVPPESFNPAPKVDSAIVRLTPHPQKPFPCRDTKLLQQVVSQAFSMRRKTLRNALKNIVSEEMFNKADIDASLRPEKLSLQQFVQLTNILIEQQNH